MGVRRGVFVLGLFIILVGSIAILIPTQPAYSTLATFVIEDNATGGDCEYGGTGVYDENTKTCLLLADLPLGSNVVIDDDEIQEDEDEEFEATPEFEEEEEDFSPFGVEDSEEEEDDDGF